MTYAEKALSLYSSPDIKYYGKACGGKKPQIIHGICRVRTVDSLTLSDIRNYCRIVISARGVNLLSQESNFGISV